MDGWASQLAGWAFGPAKCGWQNQMWLVSRYRGYRISGTLAIRDQVSTYTWFAKLSSTESSKVLDELDAMQVLYGKTKKIISDQGVQCTGSRFTV